MKYAKFIAGFIVAAVTIIAGVLLLRGTDTVVETTPIESTVTQQVDEALEEPSLADTVPEPKEVLLPETAQEVLDFWSEGTSGDASVVVLNGDGTQVAATNADQTHFGASIYKLYVAYYGYQKIDDGIYSPEELYINGHTRLECLDLMIRESDSPCAEKMWVELGKESLTAQLSEIGIQNTNMSNITTTASDAAQMLVRISEGANLSQESHAALLASMKDQIYRDALNAGFSSDLTVYNKIGFRGFDEYHDVAIVELEDGRRFIVSVLTNGVGTQNIANLATFLEDEIL